MTQRFCVVYHLPNVNGEQRTVVDEEALERFLTTLLKLGAHITEVI